MKESIVLYARQRGPLQALSMEERGEVFTALLDYVAGEDPGEMSPAAFVAYSFFKLQIDLDTERYEEMCRKRAEAGRAGAAVTNTARSAKAANAEFAETESSKSRQTSASVGKGRLNENDNENDSKRESTLTSAKEKSSRFSPPTVEEINAYAEEKGLRVDTGRFYDYYTGNGWRVGKNPMKDWKATLRNWDRQDRERSVSGPANVAKANIDNQPKPTRFSNFDQRSDDLDEAMVARLKRDRQKWLEGKL